MNHLTRLSDLTSTELFEILDLAKKLEEQKIKDGFLPPLLKGKTIALTFEKPSLRTKSAFEIAAADLGAHPLFLGPQDVFLAGDGEERESLEDITHNLERFADCIVARVFQHESIQRMAAVSSVPVINALCDEHHPTQAICDLYALREHFGKLEGLKVAWVGDGNNVALSLAESCSLTGIHFSIATPEGYALPSSETENLKSFSETSDPITAVREADVVVTDTWVSMGEESEKEKKRKIFAPYQVNTDLMKHAKSSAIFMHCLPAHRGEEVTAEVIDGSQSIVFDEAVSRLFIARALYVKLLKEE